MICVSVSDKKLGIKKCRALEGLVCRSIFAVINKQSCQHEIRSRSRSFRHWSLRSKFITGNFLNKNSNFFN